MVATSDCLHTDIFYLLTEEIFFISKCTSCKCKILGRISYTGSIFEDLNKPYAWKNLKVITLQSAVISDNKCSYVLPTYYYKFESNK